MGCAVSSFHSARRFRRIDPADFDEEYFFSEDEFGPARSFGQYRVGAGNLPPDDRQGIPSPFVIQHLASDPGPILYQAEMDHGLAYRALRPIGCCSVLLTILNPYRLCSGLLCSVDETCCWLRKEYSTRNFYYVYSNRIVTNRPQCAFPWADDGAVIISLLMALIVAAMDFLESTPVQFIIAVVVGLCLVGS